jgi:hypothetical protein
MGIVRAGLAYFALVFAAGFVLGPIRVLVLTPRLGELGAVLVEAPLMALAIVLAASWLARRGVTPSGIPARWGMGAVALACLFTAEIGTALALRGLSPSDYGARLLEPPGLVFLALAAFFAAFPALQGLPPARRS